VHVAEVDGTEVSRRRSPTVVGEGAKYWLHVLCDGLTWLPAAVATALEPVYTEAAAKELSRHTDTISSRSSPVADGTR
jgi:hypothetical protein